MKRYIFTLIKACLAARISSDITDHYVMPYLNFERIFSDAVKNDDLTMVKYLSSIGVVPPIQLDLVLNYAAAFGSLNVVNYLVSAGANSHDSALQSAAEYDRLNVIEFLVSVGANIHADNDYALQIAAGCGNLNVVKYLAAAGANIHVDDDQAARLAAAHGHLDVVKFLVAAGANIQSNWANWALSLAASKNDLDMVRFLVQHGADTYDLLLAASYGNLNMELVRILGVGEARGGAPSPTTPSTTS